MPTKSFNKNKFYIMRRFLIALTILAMYTCKQEKSDVKNDTTVISTLYENQFEKKLIDLREVKLKFNDYFEVEKFGMLKKSDTVYCFVFKLNDETENTTIDNYSIGIRAYDLELSEPLNLSFHPQVEEIDGGKYILLEQKIVETSYFDSLDVYIYKRKDWESSGRLGEIKIKDILLK